jgi:hypothetical protein
MAAPQSSQFAPNTVIDALFSFENGMNGGVSPLLLPKNQLAYASNLTTRGTLIHPRPVRRQYAFDFSAVPTLLSLINSGLWLFQGRAYYKPDLGPETLMVSISGRLFQITPNPITLTAPVVEVTGGNPQSATVLQAWLWQAENFVIWNDGINLPVFFNGTTTTRSLGPTPVGQSFTTSQPATIPNIDITLPAGANAGSAVVTFTLTIPYVGVLGDIVTIAAKSAAILSGPVTNIAGNTIDVRVFPTLFFNGVFQSIVLPTGTVITVTNSTQVAQFPPGRMGAYGRGRVWMSLANGKDFVAGDIVGGPSGTKALNFRDAVLNITENSFLVGGGNFTVPGSIGDIRAMIFTAQLDMALGQGPLMIFTPSHVFSCNAPVDRLTWQQLTNPILTEAAIGNGGLGQDSTFLINSDTDYRSVDGIRSLILSTQDFNSWVRTPISHEVERVLSRDNQALLAFGSGVFFDNRTLMTTSPISTPNGVYHQALIALNTDLITTVREKKPPAYDGVWPGMNLITQVTGEFTSVERCYQFVYNTVQKNLELWELMPESASDVQNQAVVPLVGDQILGTPVAIEWWFEGPVLFKEQNPSQRTFKQLVNGEIFVDKLVGRVDFEAFWKPDQYPCWQPWFSWSECSTQNTGAPTDNTKPQFRPRMGMGTPSSTPCDPSTNRPLVQGYNFQFKLVVTGQCEFVGARFAATVIPEPTFAPPKCSPVC